MNDNSSISFRAGSEVLAGRFIRPTHGNVAPRILFLHGAGKATKERCLPLAERLAGEYELASFTFDFSGHGASTGTLENSSLNKRVDEALAALEYAELREPISLCAFSMGGHVALELLKHKRVHSLTLFYPAIYARSVIDLRFGNPEFSAILRSNKSWEANDVLAELRNFKGNIFIVVGEKDQVIPAAVFDLLYANTVNAEHKRLLVVPDAPHLLLQTVLANEHLYSVICKTIAGYVLNSTEEVAVEDEIVAANKD
jgi:pimeloyl-ACP methyl ester carboxylesterase